MQIGSIEEFQSKIKRVIITEEEIKSAVKKAGAMINSLYDGKPILLVSILKGSFVFLADLCKQITVPCEIGFMIAKSYYEGTQSSGIVRINMDLEHDVSKYNVIIVKRVVNKWEKL